MSDDTSAATCSVCGADAPSPPVDWMREVDLRRGPVWVCASCVRANVRSIEARIDQQWW